MILPTTSQRERWTILQDLAALHYQLALQDSGWPLPAVQQRDRIQHQLVAARISAYMRKRLGIADDPNQPGDPSAL